MMGVYLYAVGGPDHPRPEAITGIDDAAVRPLEAHGLVLWVSHLERAPAASLERVRQHNTVVEASAASHTPLPMRFGQWFGSEAELSSTLAERRPGMGRALERVRDALEVGVRILDPARTEPAPPDRSSGTAYLEALARREEEAAAAQRRGAELARELREFMGPVVRADRLRPGGATGIAAIAHLVARHDTGTHHRLLRTFSERHPDLRFVPSGPWPPYGFADADG